MPCSRRPVKELAGRAAAGWAPPAPGSTAPLAFPPTPEKGPPMLHRVNRAISLLSGGQPIYYVGEHTGHMLTYDQGLEDAATWADYINVGMEHGAFDMTGLAIVHAGAGGRRPNGKRPPYSCDNRGSSGRRIERIGNSQQCLAIQADSRSGRTRHSVVHGGIGGCRPCIRGVLPLSNQHHWHRPRPAGRPSRTRFGTGSRRRLGREPRGIHRSR